MRRLKPREKPLFSKRPAGGQERRNFPSSRTKKPGVGVRAYSLRGAPEEDAEGGRGSGGGHREGGRTAGGKQPWEVLRWGRRWDEPGCGKDRTRKRAGERRGKLRHAPTRRDLGELRCAGESSRHPVGPRP